MNCNFNVLYAFLGGAIVGVGAAMLFAPEKGADLRARIKRKLREKGMCCCDAQVDEDVEDVSAKES